MVLETDGFASIKLYLCHYRIVLVSDKDLDKHYGIALLHNHFHFWDDTPLVEYHRSSTSVFFAYFRCFL